MSRKAMINTLIDAGLITTAQAANLERAGELSSGVTQGGAVADVATADSSGVANDALVNELKTQVNALLAELRTAGVIST